jgi:hypothetical protein
MWTSDDLLSGLAILGVYVAITGILTVASIWWARRHGDSTTLALDVTRNAALLFLCFLVVGVVLTAFNVLGRPTLLLSDTVFTSVQEQEDALRSSACLDDFYDVQPMLCGHDVGPIPFGVRLLVFAGSVLTLATSGAIAWAIHNAARRAAEKDPFHASVARTFGAMAIVVMITAVLGDLAQRIGTTLAARSLDWGPDAYPIRFELSFPLWAFALAVGMFALSAIFRYGAQLQQEKEHLQHETDGLV